MVFQGALTNFELGAEDPVEWMLKIAERSRFP
jgi:hypothetical protein